MDKEFKYVRVHIPTGSKEEVIFRKEQTSKHINNRADFVELVNDFNRISCLLCSERQIDWIFYAI